MSHPLLRAVVRHAADCLNPRADYARRVLWGYQAWSGADLKGKAKRFGGSYAIQRRNASEALHDAGGAVIRVEHGRLVTAVQVGCDDFGAALYVTDEGTYAPGPKSQCVRVG